MEVAKNFRFETLKNCWPSCCNYRKYEARLVKNQIADEKMCKLCMNIYLISNNRWQSSTHISPYAHAQSLPSFFQLFWRKISNLTWYHSFCFLQLSWGSGSEGFRPHLSNPSSRILAFKQRCIKSRKRNVNPFSCIAFIS